MQPLKPPPDVEPGIDLDTLFDKIGFKPHSQAQWDYCRSTTRFNVPCCGRRWGKSIATGRRMTAKMFMPDTYNWIIGPTYTLGEKEFRIVYNDFRKLGILKYCKKAYSIKQGDMRIQTPWGAILEVKSAEKPDGLLGEGLSHAVMSETARHLRMNWEQFVEPALSDLRGSCDFPSTPRGFNWYHGLWMLGQEGSKKDYTSWRFPSWTNPIAFPGGREDPEIVRIEETVSKQYFDQEYGAQFTSFSGAIYDEYDENIHVKPHTYDPKLPNFQAYDFGFANPFVCLDIQVDEMDRVYVWREYHERYKSTYEHGQALLERDNPDGYKIDGAWGDPRGANEIATLGLLGIHVAADDVPWKLGIEEIKRMLKPDAEGNPRIFIDPSCTNLRRSMMTLHVKEQTRAQRFDLQEQVGDGNIQHKVDDHDADAFRYFIGPYFVLGAGSHLEDVYGLDYRGSESNDFFTIHNGSRFDGGFKY
jgi:hypothetical protein